MELLSKDIIAGMPDAELDEVNRHAAEDVAELIAADPDRKRLFLMLTTQALTAMTLYLEQIQAEEGARILQQVAEGKEPKPAFGHVVNPRAQIYRYWETFEKEVLHHLTIKMGLGILPTSTGSVTRQIFYAGAAAVYGLIADQWPDIGTPQGCPLMEDLQIELESYERSLRS